MYVCRGDCISRLFLFCVAKFYDNLRGLLSNIIAKSLSVFFVVSLSLCQLPLSHSRPNWRTQVYTRQSLQQHMTSPLPPQSPSLPSLFLSFISSHFSSLPSPQVQDVPTHTQNRFYQLINVQFSEETLETMLDGLGKIRDQLSSVACRCGLTKIIYFIISITLETRERRKSRIKMRE